jgi:hypothetical protein
MRCETCGQRTGIKDTWEAGKTVMRTHQCENPECPESNEKFRFNTEEKITPRSAEALRHARGDHPEDL